MTEQETRNKIAEIMERVWYEPVPCTIERKHEAIVDALVEAGLRFGESYSHTATFNMALLDRINELERWLGEAEHRAEVAERALMTVCTNVVKDEEDDLAIEPRARVLYKAYLKKAEKELAEEGKDEN